MSVSKTIDDLRKVFSPVENLSPILTLNKHFSAYPNYSLYDAKNIRISDDNTVIQNEESLLANEVIYNFLNDFYNNYNIISCIACPNELVLFVRDNNTSNKDNLTIVRYNEKNNKIGIVYGAYESYYKGLNYYGGTITGTYTYNVDGSLIIAFCEYDNLGEHKLLPMQTINLGLFQEIDTINQLGIWIDTSNIFNDRDLENFKLSLVPEVNLPQFANVDYYSGKAYNAWYYIYIRYKINKIDYTQWYNIGYPICISDNNLATLIDIKSEFMQTYIGSGTDTSSKSFVLNLTKVDNRYKEYQLGFVVINKTLNKQFRTGDITTDIQSGFIFNKDNLIEENLDLNKYYNYYNVKNIINYKNRLYISNYEEDEINKIDTSSITAKLGYVDNIFISDDKFYIRDTNIVYDKMTPFMIWLYNELRDDYKKITKNIRIRIFPPYARIGQNIPNHIRTIECDIQDITVATREWVNQYLDLLTPDGQHVEGTFDRYYQKFTIGTNDTVINNEFTFRDFNTEEPTRADNYYIYQADVLGYGRLIYGIHKNIIMPGIVEICNDRGEVLYLHQVSKTEDYTKDEPTPSTPSYMRDILYHGIDIINTIDIQGYGNGQGNPSILDYSINTISQLLLLNPNYLLSNNYILTNLIPGETYDFYAHFVDKYGNNSLGYKLDNLIKYFYNNKEYTPVCTIRYDLPSPGINIYANIFVPINEKVLKYNITDNKYEINTDNIIIGNVYSSGGHFHISTKYDNYRQTIINKFINLFTTIIPDDTQREYNKINYEKNTELYYWQVSSFFNVIFENYDETDKASYNIIANNLIPGITKSGKYVWKVPMSKDCSTKPFSLTINGAFDVAEQNNYVGYFISYKKFTSSIKLVGLGNKDSIASDSINIDKTEYDCSLGLIFRNKTFALSSFPIGEGYTKNTDFYNLYQGLDETEYQYYTLVKHHIGFAGEYEFKRVFKHSLYWTNNENEIPLSTGTFYCTLAINTNNNIYDNDDEVLYRAGDILYADNNTIYNGFNGLLGYDSVIMYNEKGVIFDQGTPKYLNEGANEFIEYDGLSNDKIALSYAMIYRYTEDVLTSKFFNNRPKLVISQIEDDEVSKPDRINTEVEPQNTLDLFETKIQRINDLNPNVLYQYKEDVIYKNVYNNTLFYSNVISDESRENNWRKIKNDNYKFIAENKGKIVNLVALGNWIFVHCEHAIYSLEFKDAINTTTESLQIIESTIDNINYKEIIPTDKGFGGIQDKFAAIVGDFGYIYFDNDTKRFYRFDNNSLMVIDDLIKDYIYNIDIQTVRFAWDKKHNRILVCINENIVLSYHYLINNFVSFHDYNFKIAYNTKNNLYVFKDSNFVTSNITLVSNFKDFTFNKYNIIIPGGGSVRIEETNKYPSISIIFNMKYASMKYLEYISYKLKLYNNGKVFDNIKSFIKHYCGDTLKIYNDIIDTDELNIEINNESDVNNVTNINKPYRELGKWNFNYGRDKYNAFDTVSDEMSRLNGNFFIVEFKFNNIEDKLLIFENITCHVDYDKK